ncbi:hypothetical protein SUGI_0591100 [Cryptomeria japonica]|nr:hypothetical protein SUGI_0591100 [Cryptomeria japonica]
MAKQDKESVEGQKSLMGVASGQHPKSPMSSMHKKNQVKGNKVSLVLMTINVLGSTGPLRFLVSCDYQVRNVMEFALKSYAREGRLPVLGQNIKQFELHYANGGYGQALDLFQIIGTLKTRNFLLCKKNECKFSQEEEKVIDTSFSPHHPKTNMWKNWLNTMSLSCGISFI